MRSLFHADAAGKAGAVGDRYLRGDDVAVHRGGLRDHGLFTGPDRSLELAVEDEGADPDLGLDPAALGHGQGPRGGSALPLDAALDEHVLAGLDPPIDGDLRTQ